MDKKLLVPGMTVCLGNQDGRVRADENHPNDPDLVGDDIVKVDKRDGIGFWTISKIEPVNDHN